MNRKIKICHVINGFENGGAEAVILNYCRRMDKSKFDFHILAHEIVIDTCVEKFRELGFTVHIIPSKKKPISHIIKMYQIFKKEKFDIVHIATTEWAFVAGSVSFFAGCKVRINHSHMAEKPAELVKKISFNLKTFLGRVFTNHYWACGEDAAIALFGLKNYRNGNVLLFDNAVEIEKYMFNIKIRNELRAKYNIPQSGFVVGCVGRLSEQKNHAFAIKVFLELLKYDSSSKLLIIGDGYLRRQLSQTVIEMGIEDSVIFTGNVEDVNNYYQVLDILLMPSIKEGFPLVGVEAQASGLPIYFSDIVTSKVNYSGKCRFLSLKNDPSQWAKIIYSEKSGIRESILEDKYDIKIQAKKMENQYLSLSRYN